MDPLDLGEALTIFPNVQMTEQPEIPAEIDPVEPPLAASEPAPPSTFKSFSRLGLVYAASIAVLWIIQSGTKAIIDPDGYYHIRWSRLLWENLPHGRLPRFIWLPLTTLNENGYVDHHFLFHIFQIPFTWGPDLVAGAKASAVVYGALALLACFLLVSWEKVRYPSFWFLGILACSAPFLFRLSLPRAPSVTIVTLCLAMWLLWTRRTIWVGVLAFALVWMYSLFPLIGLLAGFWAIGVFIEERRIEWKPVVSVTVGVIAGLIINPYFPENLYLFAAHVLMKTKEDFEIGVGNEWYPYETWYLFTSSAVAFVAQAVGYIAMQRGEREGRARTITLLLFSTLLLVLTFKSRRFIEYWPVFAVLFAAFAMRPHLDRWTLDVIPAGWARRSVAAAGVVLTLAIFAGLVQNVKVTRSTVSGETNPNAYVGGTDWLKANTPEGSLVFNTDWDDFPMLFHHDTHNVYTSGLDPTYLLYANPELSRLYVDITLGKQDDPAPLIRDRFGAKWAFTDSGHRDFIRKATENGQMRIVYEDEDCVVLEVTDAAPPAKEPVA